jgi:hypothetical protein
VAVHAGINHLSQKQSEVSKKLQNKKGKQA